MFFSSKNLCTNIICQDVHAEFFFQFFWHFKICFLIIGSFAPVSRNGYPLATRLRIVRYPFSRTSVPGRWILCDGRSRSLPTELTGKDDVNGGGGTGVVFGGGSGCRSRQWSGERALAREGGLWGALWDVFWFSCSNDGQTGAAVVGESPVSSCACSGDPAEGEIDQGEDVLSFEENGEERGCGGATQPRGRARPCGVNGKIGKSSTGG
jgi:hypothetical protein